MIHPIILWQLARGGASLEPPRRRLRRPLDRPGRRRATDDPTVPPLVEVLTGRPESAAAEIRAALDALEGAGAIRDAEQAVRELANALRPRLDVTVTSRTNRAPAICEAPNCAGHRLRA